MNTDPLISQYALNILIVDDIPANLKILGDILEGSKYKVRPVLDGKLALQVAEKEKPDLILLDIMMPDMDGFEVCRRLKENQHLSDIPVIFISASNDTNNIVKALNSGGVDYITKPFRAEEVIARVNSHMKICQQNQELRKLNAEKDKFFSIIAHDLRSPLNGFLGLTQLMADDLSGMTLAEIQEIAVRMRNSANNLFHLLENLLKWSQLQRGLTTFIPTSFLLMPKIAESLELVLEPANKKGIEISYYVPEDLSVFADGNMLESTIRNLVSNAVKFTANGGKITITAKQIDGNPAKISIKDNGIGMSRAIVDNLFQLDVQTNRQGTDNEPSTGLGLIICRDFIEKHGGKLWVESEEGKGSTFSFTIPCPAETPAKVAIATFVPGEEKEIQIKKLKILIAENDETSEMLILIAVKMFGKEVLKVQTGIDAVKACRNNTDIDLILMDIRMPEMNGYEATKQIRQFNKDVVIIAQTAYGLAGDREKAIEAGCDDYISKPLSIPSLKWLIQKHFNNKVSL